MVAISGALYGDKNFGSRPYRIRDVEFCLRNG
jgi:hypothetical protein